MSLLVGFGVGIGAVVDEQTMKDYIEDLLQERIEMYECINTLTLRNEHLNSEVKRLEQELARHA